MKLKNKLYQYMQGRYGVDELYRFLFIVYIISFIINIFLKNIYLEYFGLLLVIFIFYRVLSKNIKQRAKENKIYLKIKNSFTKPIINIKQTISDKEHIYKKCPKCKTTLKLPIPYKKGIKHTKCPKCNKRLTLLILKNQKVEIINKKKK